MNQSILSDGVYFDIALRLLASLVIGGLIGLERSYHGRPAGFRTHALVCLSTSLLMLVTVYETRWFPSVSQGRISLDPTRMAQGIMTGIGFYFPAAFATVLTLGTLSVFRWIENRMPAQFYAQFAVRFARHQAMPEPEMRRLLTDHGFTVANLNYRLDVDSDSFEYQMVIRTTRADNASKLTDALNKVESVREYRLSPTGD